MAISITTLYPAKNQTAVPVADDIELTLESDTVDLDLQTIKFFINDTEVIPSAYYGIDNSSIDVKFFAKRKIKYNTKRYGQDDFRYGQRDIYPSSFQYGYRYICRVEVQDIDGNLFSESFSFTIEDGIFYNEAPTISFYYPQTQAMANYAPEWARARFDKYSNFQQFINPSNKFLQKIEDSLFDQTSSYYVQTSNLNELSTLYKLELGGGFEFQTTVLDDGTRLQIPPEIKATKDITLYEPNAEFQNNLEDFYYNKLPSRLDETKQFVSSLSLYPKTLASDSVISLGLDLERDGKFVIIIEDGQKFTQIINDDYRFIYCRIAGVSRENKDQTEDVVIIDNDTYSTTKMWKSVSTIQFINIPVNSNISFTLDHARLIDSFIPDSLNHVTVEDFEKATFWKKTDSVYGTVLQQWVLLGQDAVEIISSQGQKNLISEFELLDIDNTTNLNLIDLDADRFSNHIYGIDNNFLYIFDKREEYSSVVKKMPETNGTADFVLNIDSDNLGRGDSVKTVTISGVQKSVSKVISQFRLSVLKPNGSTVYILSDGSTTLNKLEAATVVKTQEVQYITPTFFYDLDIIGDYVIRLETVYRDGSTDIDSKIVSVPKKRALAKYKLERIFGDALIERMFIDYDQQLKILDNNNELHSIRFAKDNVLIDYSNGVLYFSEDYDNVETE